MNRIPKVIHYCWFGGNPLPELVQNCINSWKKYCPDYEIIQWDESNFDISSNQYVAEAYAARKWAFVSDYVRLYALYHNGGIYLDTDVEVLKPLDCFLNEEAFTGTGRSGIEVSGEEGDAILKGDGVYYLLCNNIPQRGSKNVIKSDGSSSFEVKFKLGEKVKSVKWLIGGEELQFVQNGEDVTVTKLPRDYGESPVVKIARIEVE